MIAKIISKTLKKFKSSYNYNTWRLLSLCCLVGIVAGFGAIIFYYMLDVAKYLFLDILTGYHPLCPGGEHPLFDEVTTPLKRWMFFILPALGGLISGIIVYRFAPEAEGHGTDAAIEAYHYKAGEVRGRIPFIKAITSAITIGTGGSGGREGPIAQIGAGFGSILSKWIKLRSHERRILMVAGMGAGVGAIFHAPMAGALFAAEVLYKDLDLEYEVIIASIIASIIAYSIFAMNFGWDHLFITPEFVFNRPIQLLPYILLAFVVAGGAILYVRTFYGVHSIFKRFKIPLYIAPAIGGFIVGCIGFFLPEALGTGYGIIQKALVNGTPMESVYGSIGIPLLIAVALGKILTTSFSIASGGSGGVFGPAIVIGGALGGAVGMLCINYLPTMGIQSGSFVIVGMAGFFAAAANTPISTIIMVSEMTGNYHLLVPSMGVCVIAYLLAHRHALYNKQLQNRFDAPIHRGNMLESILKNIKVNNVIAQKNLRKILSVSSITTLHDMITLFSGSQQSSFPVIDEGKLIGIVRSRELRLVVKSQAELGAMIIAEDLAQIPVTVTKEETLLEALKKMNLNQLEEILVVDKNNKDNIVAMLSHNNIISAYDKELVNRWE